MLNGAGNTHGDIELAGARGLAGLSDLSALGQPSRVRDRPRAAERRADGIGELAELLHLGLLADAAADGQNELGAPPCRRRRPRSTRRTRARSSARGAAGAANALTLRRRRRFRRLEHIAAHGEQHDAPAGKVDFDIDLLAVAAARRDELALDVLHLNTSVANPSRQLGGERRGVAEGIDAVRDQHDVRAARSAISAPIAASKVSGSNSARGTLTVMISSTPATLTAGDELLGRRPRGSPRRRSSRVAAQRLRGAR